MWLPQWLDQKMVTYAENLTEDGEPQRYSWGMQKKKKKNALQGPPLLCLPGEFHQRAFTIELEEGFPKGMAKAAPPSPLDLTIKNYLACSSSYFFDNYPVWPLSVEYALKTSVHKGSCGMPDFTIHYSPDFTIQRSTNLTFVFYQQLWLRWNRFYRVHSSFDKKKIPWLFHDQTLFFFMTKISSLVELKCCMQVINNIFTPHTLQVNWNISFYILSNNSCPHFCQNCMTFPWLLIIYNNKQPKKKKKILWLFQALKFLFQIPQLI